MSRSSWSEQAENPALLVGDSGAKRVTCPRDGHEWGASEAVNRKCWSGGHWGGKEGEFYQIFKLRVMPILHAYILNVSIEVERNISQLIL